MVEIGVEVTPQELERLESELLYLNIPYYIQPPRLKPYKSLDELEADCEGK